MAILKPDLLPIVLQTIVAITSLMGCMMSLVLFFVKRNYPASIKGLGDWAIVPFLAFFSSILYTTQGSWHHYVSMALPNMLVVCAVVLQLRGTYQHFGKAVSSYLLPVITLLALPLALWSSGKSEYFALRVIFVSGLSATMFGAQIKLLWMHRKGSFATHCMLTTTVFMCAVMSVRAISALIMPPPVGLYTYSPLQALYIGSYGFGVLLLSVSAILLAAEQMRNEMTKLLKHDALTGALSRRAAFEFGEDELARSARLGTVFSVLILDLDRFKNINDAHGHQVGDRVLIEFVRCVEQVLRRPAVIGRYGGEEFIVILPDSGKEEAIKVAERIQARLRASEYQPKVTTSIGLAWYIAQRDDSLNAIIGRADAALYSAKQNGRDRIVVDDATSAPVDLSGRGAA